MVNADAEHRLSPLNKRATSPVDHVIGRGGNSRPQVGCSLFVRKPVAKRFRVFHEARLHRPYLCWSRLARLIRHKESTRTLSVTSDGREPGFVLSVRTPTGISVPTPPGTHHTGTIDGRMWSTEYDCFVQRTTGKDAANSGT